MKTQKKVMKALKIQGFSFIQDKTFKLNEVEERKLYR